ncbi:unnamed protein product [Prorocentrum cordatum]|uniref:Uncharacterized protein n=1 Tax=Prorocentrum cordatum TaxID=2364126 RepID=A0ABN9W9M3_9DINO|nr:unnamed protein product [Polarella glacialis]
MVRKQMNPEQEATNLHLRANEAQQRAWRARIRKGVANCPSLLPKIIKLMDTHGYTDERISTPEEQEKSHQAVAVEQRTAKRRAGAVHSGSAEVQKPDDAAGPVPTKYWHLTRLSRNLLRDEVLPGAEPNNLTSANLRACMDKLGVAAAHQEYLHIWEFVTGKKCLDLNGPYRWFSEIRKLAYQRGVVRGRRGLLLALPPNWPKDGLCEIVGMSECGKMVVAKQKFTEEEVSIQVEKLPSHQTVEQLWIDMNWSEEDMAIKSTQTSANEEDMKPYALANDFKNHIVKKQADIPGSRVKRAKVEPKEGLPVFTPKKAKIDLPADDAGASPSKLEPGLAEPAGTAQVMKALSSVFDIRSDDEMDEGEGDPYATEEAAGAPSELDEPGLGDARAVENQSPVEITGFGVADAVYDDTHEEVQEEASTEK